MNSVHITHTQAKQAFRYLDNFHLADSDPGATRRRATGKGGDALNNRLHALKGLREEFHLTLDDAIVLYGDWKSTGRHV
jgi:hypothetical protein